jgi:hypothetical protein
MRQKGNGFIGPVPSLLAANVVTIAIYSRTDGGPTNSAQDGAKRFRVSGRNEIARYPARNSSDD